LGEIGDPYESARWPPERLPPRAGSEAPVRLSGNARGIRVDLRRCPYCGQGNPPTSRFCGACGRPLAAEPTAHESDPWVIGRYSGWRFQVDPSDPPPVRDARWLLVILGVGLAVAGLLLLVLDSLVTGALSLASGGCSGACAGPFVYLFFYPGIALLGAGFVLAGIALSRTL
jgi:hypothetical protein